MPARTVVPQLRIRVTPIPVPFFFSFFFTCFCFGSRCLNISFFNFFLSTIYVSTIFSILFSLQATLTRARLRIDVKKLISVAERQMEIQIARFCFLWLLKISLASENLYRRVL